MDSLGYFLIAYGVIVLAMSFQAARVQSEEDLDNKVLQFMVAISILLWPIIFPIVAIMKRRKR